MSLDHVKAGVLEASLVGQEIDGWAIQRLINHGKSAAVFQAERNGVPAAIKIFDTDLIEKYGDETQIARIQRETSLVGKHHKNVVAIYGGGYDEKLKLHYIIMEFIDGPNLKQCLDKIADAQIGDLIFQLSEAARYLESLGLVHRDIKPENISILDDGKRLVLLDLGVIKPIGIAGLTDPEEIKAFIGTLQYSSPEFLVRDEVDDQDGWRALTFYQMGAVLHDMIMKRPLFDQFSEPYAKLVIAIQQERPVIVNPDVDPKLVSLAGMCLLKKPDSRLRLLDWQSFDPNPSGSASATPRDRVLEALASMRAAQTEIPPPPRPLTSAQLKESVLKSLRASAIGARARMEGLPPLVSRILTSSPKGLLLQLEAGTGPFTKGLCIWIDVDVHDPVEGVIECVGIALSGQGLPRDVRQRSVTWHRSVLDSASLNSSLEDFFYRAIEWFIHASPGLNDGDQIFWSEGGLN